MTLPPDDGGPYRTARTVGGLLLLLTASIVYVQRPSGDTSQLLVMVGCAAALLGVDIVKRFIR